MLAFPVSAKPVHMKPVCRALWTQRYVLFYVFSSDFLKIDTSRPLQALEITLQELNQYFSTEFWYFTFFFFNKRGIFRV